MSALPELKVTVFSDYICPFCYIGHHRLMHLKKHYNLKINWCFLEIHPETPEQGEPVSSLDYPSQTWQKMMTKLKAISKKEQIALAELNFIFNSKNALLLSEAAKQAGKACFYALHNALFKAYFVETKNIANKKLLHTLATDCGITEEIIEAAWTDPTYALRLQNNYHAAREHAIESVPSFIFGNKVLTGAVSETVMRNAAESVANY